MPSPAKRSEHRIILHVDLDAYFASVEEREKPELRGKPIIVGADPKSGHGRGVVSTCNYLARAFGIRSGMPISIAWRKCPAPECVYLPVNIPLYVAVSEKIMAIIKKYADAFEHGGIDECYLDVSKRCKNFAEAAELAKRIQEDVHTHERLTCSVGIGPNKLIAKVSSDFQKPHGLTVVGPAAVARFLSKLAVRKLQGVGPKTEAALETREIRTIGQLKQTPRFALIEWFGRAFGEHLYYSSRGIDESPIVEHWEAKSIGREWTFEHDTNDRTLIVKTLDELSKGVFAEFRAEFTSFKTVTVKVRYQGFETHTHQQTLKPDNSLQPIIETSHALLEPYLTPGRKIRLIGVRLSGLEKSDEEKSNKSGKK